VKLWITNELQNISAFRLELLTDPNLPCNGPGRSFKGTCALTEFKLKHWMRSSPRIRSRESFAKVTAIMNRKKRPWNQIFTDKTDKKRVTGPAQFAMMQEDTACWESILVRPRQSGACFFKGFATKALVFGRTSSPDFRPSRKIVG